MACKLKYCHVLEVFTAQSAQCITEPNSVVNAIWCTGEDQDMEWSGVEWSGGIGSVSLHLMVDCF